MERPGSKESKMYEVTIDKLAVLKVNSVYGTMGRKFDTYKDAQKYANKTQDRMNSLKDGFLYTQNIRTVGA